MANEVVAQEKQQIATNLSQWTNGMLATVEHEYNVCGVPFDEYSRLCGVNAMSNIYQLVVSSGLNMNEIDTSNMEDIIKFCASNKLNCNAVPAECFFKIVNKKVGNGWTKQIEVSMQGAGFESQLRLFGVGVAEVYPTWIIKDGDYFVPPKHKGIEVTPPEWESKGLSQKTVRIVIPIKMKDGTVQYKMSDRESVKTNLIAHVRNNLMNETFGLAESRFKATAEQKAKIDANKAIILNALKSCGTVDEMLNCKEALPYISAAWTDSPESMITRKMINNACKQVSKDMNPIAKASYTVVADPVYRDVTDEIAEEANSEAFVMPEMP